MKFFPRMLLFLYAGGIAFVTVMVLLQYAGMSVLGTGIRIFDETAAWSIIFLLLSIFFMFYRTKAREQQTQTIQHKMENGDVQISYETIEQLATRAALKIRGVHDLKTRVRANDAGVARIAVRVQVEPDTDIPKVTKELQDSVKLYVETTTGVSVDSVSVYVTELAPTRETVKKRVE